jgi:hypothetical protein
MASDEEKVRPAFERTVWEWQFGNYSRSPGAAAAAIRGAHGGVLNLYLRPQRPQWK